MEKIILTEEGFKELQERLKVLKNELIPAVVQRIKVAREQGDLSENAEQHAARDEKAKLDGEAEDIEAKLKYGEVVVNDRKDIIQVGSKVKYLDLDENAEYVFTIVGTAEADLTNNKISNESPIGAALINRKVGEFCTVTTQKGYKYQIKILEILAQVKQSLSLIKGSIKGFCRSRVQSGYEFKNNEIKVKNVFCVRRG